MIEQVGRVLEMADGELLSETEASTQSDDWGRAGSRSV